MSRYLLDTQVLLWWLSGDPRLDRPAAREIADGRNDVYISAATTWEISIKKAIGKLEAPDDLDAVLDAERFFRLPISLLHGQLAGALPPIHRDPFDRMLIAQARAEELTIITADRDIPRYDVKTFPAS